MSDYIPLDIQIEILKRLPVVSVIRFLSVSKQWKSLIENYEFISDHTRINHDRSHHHILLGHKLYRKEPLFTSIIDDDNFPNQKSSLPLPPPLCCLPYYSRKVISSVNGLSFLHGYYSELNKSMAVLWNPIIRKSVGVVIPAGSNNRDFVIGFGFCSDTSDPKLVRINRVYQEREVMVFALSSRVWKTMSNVLPALGSCCLTWNQVCNKGCIYWCAKDYSSGEDGETNVIVSFDLESEKFGQVCLPKCLLQTTYWKLAEVNESLGVLADDYHFNDEVRVCGVWMMDFVAKSFIKMFTITQWRYKCPYHGLYGVLGFRKNGEVIVEVMEDGINKSGLKVYEPSSRRFNGIGINGKSYRHSVSLCMETLLLLDQTSSIIH